MSFQFRFSVLLSYDDSSLAMLPATTLFSIESEVKLISDLAMMCRRGAFDFGEDEGLEGLPG